MKRAIVLGLAAVGVFASNAAMASADLARAKNCVACHAASSKLLGPSYKDIATKYAAQKDAEPKLVQKVLKGSSGVWGAVPMPANTGVSEAEAQALVKWILTQK